MATLARVTDFIPLDPILSGQVDSEFNQLVNALNSTSTNINLIVRFSSASVAVQKLDQLGAGPIEEWAQAGLVKASVTNAGSFSTSQQLISTLATGTKPIDVTSTTVCTNLNADQVDGFHAASFARLDNASDQTFDGNLIISNNAPQLTLIDENNTKQMRIALDNTVWNFINDTLASNAISIATADNVATFGAIPVLPASNPTTDNQAARKKYVDDTIAAKLSAISASWFYSTPPGAVESVESVPRFNCPTGTSITITKLRIVFADGSHTAGGTLTFTLKRRNSSGVAQSDIGTVTLDNTNNTKDTVYTNDIGDVALSDGDQVYPLLTTRSGSITELKVSVHIIGTQKLT